jgi:histidinol-phosphate/aromatic aminotransferase/cobyric acid decarboxylase-like protein
VAKERVFLTTGATEANSDVMFYLFREAVRKSGRVPRFRSSPPEYPPLVDAPEAIGYRRVGPREAAELTVCSQPNNPLGTRDAEEPFALRARGSAAILVDETFREFTTARSRAASGERGLWVTGSFTKVYGADAIRVGYVAPPPEEAVRFRQFADRVLHPISPMSVGAALAILEHRVEILRETRSVVRQNLAALRHRLRGVPELAAPLWFDRGEGVLPGDTFARRALDAGVLVCSGSFFGDATGVRICLTRRTFPEDLGAYLSVRDRFL